MDQISKVKSGNHLKLNGATEYCGNSEFHIVRFLLPQLVGNRFHSETNPSLVAIFSHVVCLKLIS